MVDYLDVVTDMLGVFEDRQRVHKLNTMSSPWQQEAALCMSDISLHVARTNRVVEIGYRLEGQVGVYDLLREHKLSVDIISSVAYVIFRPLSKFL
jgi:hypothetical protein